MADIYYCNVQPEHEWEDTSSLSDCGEFSQDAIDNSVAWLDEQWFPKEPGQQPSEIEHPLEQYFASLVAEWRDATENVSSLTQILSHPAYQRVIDLGKRGRPVVSLILKDLEKDHGYWSAALQAISGENPVPPKHIGSHAKIREDWLKWGKARGYI